MERLFKEIARQSGRLPDGGKYIYVFSLKGEPLCKYVLDHYIYGIWVDEDTKTIIATDVIMMSQYLSLTLAE